MPTPPRSHIGHNRDILIAFTVLIGLLLIVLWAVGSSASVTPAPSPTATQQSTVVGTVVTITQTPSATTVATQPPIPTISPTAPIRLPDTGTGGG